MTRLQTAVTGVALAAGITYISALSATLHQHYIEAQELTSKYNEVCAKVEESDIQIQEYKEQIAESDTMYISLKQAHITLQARAAQLEAENSTVIGNNKRLLSEIAEMKEQMSEDVEVTTEISDAPTSVVTTELVQPEEESITEVVQETAPAEPSELPAPEPSASTGSVLTAAKGVNYNQWGNKETYYNLNMSQVVANAQARGCVGEYWVRDDGVKMFGNYVIVAANLNNYPRGSFVNTSLGEGIVLDTGGFASKHPNQFDIATNW